ncbi:hypothetical protein BGW38_008427 [Lunasporangiospora selenospora]|uniref:DUF202 domain-containing protein n=1 Tax=Lunasporangiospora selenospora TaxID=979761 RepID=A0A9P6G354_9FUNG|nr:hypothetical protein BGW38_008427 [Lunasporangiospora selenospora]
MDHRQPLSNKDPHSHTTVPPHGGASSSNNCQTETIIQFSDPLPTLELTSLTLSSSPTPTLSVLDEKAPTRPSDQTVDILQYLDQTRTPEPGPAQDADNRSIDSLAAPSSSSAKTVLPRQRSDSTGRRLSWKSLALGRRVSRTSTSSREQHQTQEDTEEATPRRQQGQGTAGQGTAGQVYMTYPGQENKDSNRTLMGGLHSVREDPKDPEDGGLEGLGTPKNLSPKPLTSMTTTLLPSSSPQPLSPRSTSQTVVVVPQDSENAVRPRQGSSDAGRPSSPSGGILSLSTLTRRFSKDKGSTTNGKSDLTSQTRRPSRLDRLLSLTPLSTLNTKTKSSALNSDMSPGTVTGTGGTRGNHPDTPQTPLTPGKRYVDARTEKRERKEAFKTAKTLFSNERTFIHWIKFGMLLGALAMTLLNFGSPGLQKGVDPALANAAARVGQMVGVGLMAICLLCLAYAAAVYHWRHIGVVRGMTDNRYFDRIGPTVLTLALLITYSVNVILTIQTTSMLDRNYEPTSFLNKPQPPVSIPVIQPASPPPSSPPAFDLPPLPPGSTILIDQGDDDDDEYYSPSDGEASIDTEDDGEHDSESSRLSSMHHADSKMASHKSGTISTHSSKSHAPKLHTEKSHPVKSSLA